MKFKFDKIVNSGKTYYVFEIIFYEKKKTHFEAARDRQLEAARAPHAFMEAYGVYDVFGAIEAARLKCRCGT